MKTPESEIIYNYVNEDVQPKRYLHFSGKLWTPTLAYAWRGTFEQLKAVLAHPDYRPIADNRARARKVKRVKPTRD